MLFVSILNSNTDAPTTHAGINQGVGEITRIEVTSTTNINHSPYEVNVLLDNNSTSEIHHSMNLSEVYKPTVVSVYPEDNDVLLVYIVLNDTLPTMSNHALSFQVVLFFNIKL